MSGRNKYGDKKPLQKNTLILLRGLARVDD